MKAYKDAKAQTPSRITKGIYCIIIDAVQARKDPMRLRII
ncbi:hypothetical protein HNQ88_002496 [Aureibacter tunicatorum]|uniref:Uncharacterized protein n=1 Tax=Aureibacter tunicatorum TaxID=866807 RepID=A0AAE3XP39_9BACT|nr:hypothetical protein [Aureibacter tunicatorum]